VIEGMIDWQNRPLDCVYPVIFLDAVHVKIRDGKVADRPIYVALAVTVEGHRDILGLWAGGGGEGAKFWLQVLSELRNRGVADACMVVCDGLKGLPDAIGQTWPEAVVQTCVIHLLRASFRYAGRQHWDAIAKALKPVYTAATEAAAQARFDEFTEVWGPSIRRSSGCGTPVGRSSCRSSRSTPRSARSCARPTRSSRSTPGSAGPSGHGGTSRTSRLP
jgi:transposase-like protein